jgi:hypothetical protein
MVFNTSVVSNPSRSSLGASRPIGSASFEPSKMRLRLAVRPNKMCREVREGTFKLAHLGDVTCDNVDWHNQGGGETGFPDRM